MRRFRFLFFLAGCLLSVGAKCAPTAASLPVYHSWGVTFGKADTTNDFLIYHAMIPKFDSSRIYVVGKSTKDVLPLKEKAGAFKHAKDEFSDAFLACFSTEGILIWSTYLPPAENGYINGFASCIGEVSDSTFMVVCNDYRYDSVNMPMESVRERIPLMEGGKIHLLEFGKSGKLLRQTSFEAEYMGISADLEPMDYPPRIFSILTTNASSGGHGGGGNGGGHGNENLTIRLSGQFIIKAEGGNNAKGLFCSMEVSASNWDKQSRGYFASTLKQNDRTLYLYDYWLDDYNYHTLSSSGTGINIWCSSNMIDKKQAKDGDRFGTNEIYTKGKNRFGFPLFAEQWFDTSSSPALPGMPDFPPAPLNTLTPGYTYNNNTDEHRIVPGSVQNVLSFDNHYLVQGVHSQNYQNGFAPNAYSHPQPDPIQNKNGVFSQTRPASSTHAPYMALYRKGVVDFQALPTDGFPYMALYRKGVVDSGGNYFEYPYEWYSFLPGDWYYEDFFSRIHLTKNPENYYLPYDPTLLVSGDRFFLIGNARSMDKRMITQGSFEQNAHHQGILLAFSTDCPSPKTSFQTPRFLCPNDSVELKLPESHTGFRFRFDSVSLAQAAIVLNADSTRAWAKKEGAYRAILDGSRIGCPNATTDTVRIKLSSYPEPVSALPHDTIVSCAAYKPLVKAVATHDSTFSYRWHDQDSVYAKAVRFSGDSVFWAKVDVSGYCTSFRDSAVIRFLPPYVNLGEDPNICLPARRLSDTLTLLSLSAKQNYFPAADWFFRWQINGKNAGNKDTISLRVSNTDSILRYRREAVVSVFVSLSDTASAGCTAADTLRVSLFSLPDTSKNVFLPQDSVLCAHLDLDLPLPVESSLFRCFWLDKDSIVLPGGGDTNRFVIAGMRGIDSLGGGTDTRVPRLFQLRLQHRYCNISYFDSITVFDLVKPTLELPWHDSLICRGNPIEMEVQKPHVYLPFYQFLWNSGEKDANRKFTDSGTYVLMFAVKDSFNFCKYVAASDTVRIQAPALELTNIALPSDTTFCEKLSVTFDASVPFPSTRYSWQSGTIDGLEPPTLADTVNDTLFTSPIRKFDKSSTFVIFLLDTMGCVNAHQLNVTTEDCKPLLEIPNVFTPNGDGVNDVLRFKQIEKCYNVDILIVDRKGTRVLDKKLKNPDEFEWNGCFNNGSRKLPDGAYFYFISYKDAYGKRKSQSGSITILGSRE